MTSGPQIHWLSEDPVPTLPLNLNLQLVKCSSVLLTVAII